jgi:hypothetical protein
VRLIPVMALGQSGERPYPPMLGRTTGSSRSTSPRSLASTCWKRRRCKISAIEEVTAHALHDAAPWPRKPKPKSRPPNTHPFSMPCRSPVRLFLRDPPIRYGLGDPSLSPRPWTRSLPLDFCEVNALASAVSLRSCPSAVLRTTGSGQIGASAIAPKFAVLPPRKPNEAAAVEFLHFQRRELESAGGVAVCASAVPTAVTPRIVIAQPAHSSREQVVSSSCSTSFVKRNFNIVTIRPEARSPVIVESSKKLLGQIKIVLARVLRYSQRVAPRYKDSVKIA